MGECLTSYLGLVLYEPALRLQQRLVEARVEHRTPDILLLLQHPPVFTIGRFRGENEIIAPPIILTWEGIEVFRTNRGGSVTYHGPGQLVGYPILNLRELGLGVRDYIWKLEEVIIQMLGEFGISGKRKTEYPGVWVGSEKICSLGINVSRHITMHGFALNVSTNLKHFSYINPCGMKGAVMTSISKVIGHPVDTEVTIEPLLQHFSDVFGVNCIRDINLAKKLPDALVRLPATLG